MRVGKLGNPKKLVLLNYNKYTIDWDSDGASKIEVKFRNLIYPYWRNSIVLYQPRIPGSLLRMDFLNVNKRLCVEVDGEQHGEFNKHFHSNSRNVYLGSIIRDFQKDEWCEQNNIKTLHLNGEDLNNFSRKYILDKYNIDIL